MGKTDGSGDEGTERGQTGDRETDRGGRGGDKEGTNRGQGDRQTERGRGGDEEGKEGTRGDATLDCHYPKPYLHHHEQKLDEHHQTKRNVQVLREMNREKERERERDGVEREREGG